MNIKSRLSVQFTLLVFAILLFFNLLVYVFLSRYLTDRFRETLLNEARNTAILLLDVKEISTETLDKIQDTTKLLEKEEIVILDSENHLIYSHSRLYITDYILRRHAKNQKTTYFSAVKRDGICYIHNNKSQTLRVYVLAYDKSGAEILRKLREIKFLAVLVSLLLSATVSYFFSNMAIRPISKIISDVRSVNSGSLGSRLDEGRGKDEIEQLAITFNRMLSDLEQVFESQKEFVSNASHELRTPLAVMIAESEYILNRVREPAEYMDHISKMNKDLRRLNHLLNGMLTLAFLNPENPLQLSDIRMDELILNVILSLQAQFPGRKIVPEIEFSENYADLVLKGNSGLLEIAFGNVIHNACKFSSGDVKVEILKSDKLLIVRVNDQGIGIPPDQIPHIFKPFNRADNARYIGGFGVGLSIVSKIMELHSAEIKVNSREGEGTCFEFSFKKV
jgi:signal transduction histidine kinase